MKVFILVFIMMDTPIFAKTPEYKTWKTFKSNIGYSFKYPSCWNAEIDDSDEDGAVSAAKDIIVEETSACATKRLDSEMPNGIGFRGGWGPKKNQSDAVKDMKLILLNASRNVRRGEYFVKKLLIYGKMGSPEGALIVDRKFTLGTTDAVGWVELQHSYLRWQFKIYCPDRWISITGPAIDYKNIDKSVFKKFKNGDFALPKPYDSVIDSIRCIPAK